MITKIGDDRYCYDIDGDTYQFSADIDPEDLTTGYKGYLAVNDVSINGKPLASKESLDEEILDKIFNRLYNDGAFNYV